MSILMDSEIRHLCDPAVLNRKPMINPFIPHQVRGDAEGNRILSYGLSSAGYDVRLGNKFKIFTNLNSTIVDPLDFKHDCLVDHEGDHCIIPPNSYVLGHTIEEFAIPSDVMVICLGKSTLARSGLIINTTPIEPGFEGDVVIEIANATSLPVKIHAGMGVAQFLFFKGKIPCEVSYGARSGKYQGQKGLTLAKV